MVHFILFLYLDFFLYLFFFSFYFHGLFSTSPSVLLDSLMLISIFSLIMPDYIIIEFVLHRRTFFNQARLLNVCLWAVATSMTIDQIFLSYM